MEPPPTPTPAPPRDAALAVAEVAVLALLLLLALSSNALVLLALRSPPRAPRGPGQPLTPPDPISPHSSSLTPLFPPQPPPTPTPAPPRDAALAVAEVAVLALLLLLALSSNALVLLALRSPPRAPRGPGQPPARPARPLRRYLRHLSLADLAAAAGLVLPQLLWDLTDRFRGPDPLCRLTKYLQGVAMFASAYVAVAMAWDRHRAICRPLGTAPGRDRRRAARGSRGTECCGWARGHRDTAGDTAGDTGGTPTRSQATTGDSGATTGDSGATMRGTGATTGVPQPHPAGSGATTDGSWATTGDSRATTGDSGATTGVPQPHPAGSGATTGDSGATTGVPQRPPAGGSEATMALCRASGSWCGVAAGRARSGLARARSGLAWARSGLSRACSGLSRARSGLARARRRWDALATAWALALLFGLPQVGIFGQREVAPGESDCWATFAQPWGARAYVTWVALAVLVAPAVLLGVLLAAVARALRGPPRLPGGHGGLGRARAKSHRMAVVVLGVFVLCWTPFFCAQLWAVWDPRAPREGPAFTILMLLASLTSCTNPWISAAFSASLARAMARLLCPCRHRGDTGDSR
nr:vasopressin V2 receptor-like [Taeniopygia guttata]